MQVKIIANKQDWDTWLLQSNQHSFLQSWQWGEILCAKGRQIARLAIVENDKIDCPLNVSKRLKEEEKWGLTSIDWLEDFGDKVRNHISII